MELFSKLSELILGNYYIAPFIAFISGIIASFLPCSLTSYPLLISYISNSDKKQSFKYSLFFAIGSALMFVVIGIVISLTSIRLNFLNKYIYILFGILMMFSALYFMGIIKVKKINIKTNKKGSALALLTGIISSVFTGPCSTPILITILGIAASFNNIVFSIILLLCYSLGNMAIIVIFGSLIGLTDKLVNSKKYELIGKILNVITVIFILLVGFYMFYLGF